MKRILKIIGIISLVFVLAIAGVIVYLIATVDLDQIKQQISESVKKETGRELLIKGKLDLNFFPWLGVEIGETHFGNAAGFPGDFASFSNAQASLKLMPLFSSQVELKTLVFDDFILNLHQRKDGINNWDDLAKAGEQKPAGKTAPAEEPGAAGALALFLEGIDIRNANVNYKDDQAGSTTSLAGFNLSVGQVGLRRDVPFTMDFKITLSDPQIAGDYRIKGITNFDPNTGLVKVRDLIFNSDLKATGLPVEAIDLGFTANLVFDLNRMRLDVEPFALETTLKGEEIPNKSAKLTVKTALAFDIKAMAGTLKPLTIGIPGGTIEGDLAYAQKGQKKQLDFNLNADQIDLNRFVVPAPVTTTEAVPEKPAGKAAAKKTAAADNEGLLNLLVNGNLKVGKLIKDTLLVTDIAMHIKLRDGILDINPMTAKLYQGLANNDINVDLRGAAPKIKAKLDVKGFQVGNYLQATMDKDVIEGTAEVSADLQLTAADADSIKRSLNGTAAFKVGEGALKGVNIPDLIRRAKATLSGQELPPASKQTTDFTELSGTASITDGLVSNNDLSMKSPLLRIGGKGTANLPQEQVNYLVTTKLVAALTGQGGDDLKDLVGIPIPIRITGSFSAPDWQLDLQSVFEEKVKGQAQDVIDEALKDPQKALQDPKKLLEGFKFK
jgi:AsmA protein